MFVDYRVEFKAPREASWEKTSVVNIGARALDPLFTPRVVEQAPRWDTNDPRPADARP